MRILLPPGERVTGVEILEPETRLLGEGLVPLVAQPPRILGAEVAAQPLVGSSEIYQGDELWPADPVLSWREDLFRGYRILTVVLSPLRFHGSEARLRWHPQMEIRISTELDGLRLVEDLTMLRRDEETRERVAGLIDNPEILAAYPEEGEDRIGQGAVTELDYLIVTGDAWAEGIRGYAEFLRSRGHHTEIFTKSWILEEYSGRDEPEAIRNFLVDIYQESEADYLLLVGDARDENGIPHRGLFCRSYNTTDYDLPADIYYGALDGDWNADGDGRWGEPGEADLYPELSVGRACVSDEAGLQNFIRKQMLYQEAPVVDQVSRMLMVGERLWNDPLTWGGDYLDEIWRGSTANGLRTCGVPSSMTVAGLYERDWFWMAGHLSSLIDSGVGIVNHQGHAYYNLAAKLSLSDLDALGNDGVTSAHGFFYSQGCYCGSFDNKASYGGYHADCFAEDLTTTTGGAAAAVMNSRYGWGDAGGTAGPSQFFDREFFDALFGESIREAGRANDDSKMDLAWMIDFEGMRWCHYDLNLFGDPAMQIWTRSPRPLRISELSGLVLHSEELSLRVFSYNAPVNRARVTLYSAEQNLILGAKTMVNGMAVLQMSPLQAGSYALTVWRDGFVPIRLPIVIGTDEVESEPPLTGNDQAASTAPPKVLSLGPSRPNPFNPRTRLSFHLPDDASITLRIYDVEGRLVRSLIEGETRAAGSHETPWDGRSDSGEALASGVYFSVLNSEGRSDTGKLLLLK